MANETELKNVENKIPSTDTFVKKKTTDYTTEINGIKNDYVTNAALTSQLNHLKNQHIADEVKKLDDKTKKKKFDILGFESRRKQKEDLTTELESEVCFNRGNYYYNKKSYLLFEPKSKSYNTNGGVIDLWISTGIHNYSKNTDLFSVKNIKGVSPALKNDNNRLRVLFRGNNKIDYIHDRVVNVYIVYKINDLNDLENSKIRNKVNPDFTAQNCLFGAVK